MPSPFPCSPVIREYSWKKTEIEKKKSYNIKNLDVFVMNRNWAILVKVRICHSKVFGGIFREYD